MIERTIARRYASALLALADQAKAVEAVETELLGMKAAWKASPDLRKAMTHPLIAPAAKKQIARQAFPGQSKLMTEFVDRLIDKKRAGTIPEIADVFDDLADRYAGVVRMTVETAVPMAEAQKARLQGKLASLAPGHKIEVDAKVNPELLGGVRVRIRDSVIDGSVAGRLHGLRELLTSTMR